MGAILPFVTGVIWLYVVSRCVRLLPLRTPWRVALAGVLLLVAEYQVFTSHFFGSLASPELPRWILIVLAWAFGSLLLLAMLVLLRDVVGLVTWVFARRIGRGILKGKRLAATVGVAAMLLSAFGVWQAIKVPRVKDVEITLAGLPNAFDGYRIVQLSDLHASRLLPGSWITAVVARTDALRPDLIVITGDLEDGTPAARARDVRPLRDLHARDGVLAVPGNHEYYVDYAGWMVAFRELGLHMLVNAHVLVGRDGATLAVAGVTDPQAAAFGQPPPDLAAALADIPSGVPVILLSHHPGNAIASARAGVALELAGHTHGGQIRGPDLLTKWANRGFVSGLYRVGAMQLYVSNGTGLWNGLALRLGRPSEITRITLRSGRR
ncbi:MAG: metallophosphoesterase [Proteobacteria bacterium]|nr:metallophosphoesterase [Pseudomonadota bacterium]